MQQIERLDAIEAIAVKGRDHGLPERIIEK